MLHLRRWRVYRDGAGFAENRACDINQRLTSQVYRVWHCRRKLQYLLISYVLISLKPVGRKDAGLARKTSK